MLIKLFQYILKVCLFSLLYINMNSDALNISLMRPGQKSLF